MKWIALALAGCAALMPATASAFTGAQLLESSETYGRAYVWGVVESLLVFGQTEDDRKFLIHRRACVEQASLTDKSMYEAVSSRIRAQPPALKDVVAVTVARVMFDMCGLPDGQR